MDMLDGDRRDPASSSLAEGEHAGHDQVVNGHPDPMASLALLGLGMLLQGSDLVTEQIRRSGLVRDAAQAGPADTQNGEVTRRALIGLVAESRARARRRREAARQARQDFVRRLSRAASPVTRWLPVEVALTAAEILADYGQRTVDRTVDRLAEQGRIEEERARLLAQRAVVGWLDDALTYATRNPEVRELVIQQGEELATSTLDEMRTRSESVDTWLAQATRRVLKRSSRTPAPAAGETVIAPQIGASGSGA